MSKGEIDISLDKWLAFDIPMMNERVAVNSLFINEKEINTDLTKSLLG